MSRAEVTLSLPLPNEATLDDALALGQMVARIIKESPAARLGLVADVARVELVRGNRLGRAGAAALLDQMGSGA